MPVISCADDGTDQLPSLRRLVTVRWAALALMTGLLLLVPPALDVPLPGAPLLAIIGITALLNAIAAWRLKRADSATSVELHSQLLIDIFALSALVFFSGGATNPLVSLLLPPVAIAALTLPVRYVAAVGAIAIAAYSALMFFYVPLAMSDATRATRLHLLGMWLTFAVSALMVAWFAVRMTKLIRQRDAELATAREQALRDERIMAIGTLAAGAAHELGTPLGTMALVAGELARDPQLPDAAREDVALLRQQIGVCKEIITGLSRRAGQNAWRIHRCTASGSIACVSIGMHPTRPAPAPELSAGQPGISPTPAGTGCSTCSNAASSPARRPQLDWTASHWPWRRDRADFRKVLASGRPPFPARKRQHRPDADRSAIEQLGGRLR
jgi:two-component system sensor histidine kinase RegB